MEEFFKIQTIESSGGSDKWRAVVGVDFLHHNAVWHIQFSNLVLLFLRESLVIFSVPVSWHVLPPLIPHLPNTVLLNVVYLRVDRCKVFIRLEYCVLVKLNIMIKVFIVRPDINFGK